MSKKLRKILLAATGLFLIVSLSACGNQQAQNQNSNSQDNQTQQSQSQNNSGNNNSGSTENDDDSTAQPIQITNHYLTENHFQNTPQWYVKHADKLFRASRHGSPTSKDMISLGAVDNRSDTENSLNNSETSINMKYASNKVYMIGWIMTYAHHLWAGRQKQIMGDETQTYHVVLTASHNQNDYKRAIALYQSGVNFAKQHHLKGASFGGEESNHSVIWQSSDDVEMFKGPTQKIPEKLLPKED